MNPMDSLVKEYQESEAELVRTKKIYDQLQQLVLQEKDRQRREEIEISPVKKVSSDTSSTLRGTRSKSSSRSLKDMKSSPSVNASKSNNPEAKPSVAKSVERTIHYLENYKNVLRQSKVPPERIAFLNLLHNSD